MSSETTAAQSPSPQSPSHSQNAALTVLMGLSFCHLLNDMMQSLLPALYPILKTRYDLDFGQIGLITLTFQITASLLQPLVGMATDKKPRHYSLTAGMGFTLIGIIMLASAKSFPMLLLAGAMIGTGSSIFHPEASRVARLASGGKHGFAQSLFQVGGNAGSAIGPLIAAFVILPLGQSGAAWFALAALLGMVLLFAIGNWYRAQHPPKKKKAGEAVSDLSPTELRRTIGVLLALIFSKQFYLASITSFYTFYLMDRFALSIRDAQLSLFVFLGAAAVGTIIGGPIGDRIGRKRVIWISILGILPFTLVLPYANLYWTLALSVPIGMVLASAFPAIVVYAQELMPGRVGMVAGLFFGFAFGMAGVGAGVLGYVADHTSIAFVYQICSFLPLLGLLAIFLPDNHKMATAKA